LNIGEIIQAIDMNQSMDFEESLKMRPYVEEMQYDRRTDVPRYTLVGCPEQIYSEHVSAVGRFMALQDMSFVTIVQRVLAYTGTMHLLICEEGFMMHDVDAHVIK
jgi:callose synthase